MKRILQTLAVLLLGSLCFAGYNAGTSSGSLVYVKGSVNVGSGAISVSSGSIGITDGVSTVAVDALTRGIITIESVHSEVHQGEMYLSCLWDASLANGATQVMLLIAPSTRTIHLTFYASAGGDADVALYLNPTVVSSGTTLDSIQMNRTNAKPSLVRAYHTTNGETDGSLLLAAFLAGGTGGVTSGGLIRSDTEFVIAQGTSVQIVLRNDAGTSQPANIVAQYYEE